MVCMVALIEGSIGTTLKFNAVLNGDTTVGIIYAPKMFSESLHERRHVHLRIPFDADTCLARLLRSAMPDHV
jgi:hypothetical protein